MDLALSNLQSLICHKTQTNKQQTSKVHFQSNILRKGRNHLIRHAVGYIVILGDLVG